jgi:phosphatidylglycerophosphate synthase
VAEPAPRENPEAPSRPEDEIRRLRAAIKQRDAWWARVVIGPIANRLVGRLAPYPQVTPNRLTAVSLAVGLLAAELFAAGTRPAAAAGAIVLQLSFVLDCADGQLSRFRGTSTLFGAVLDKLCDRLKLFAVTFAIGWGLFRATGEVEPLVLGFVYFFAEHMIELYVTTYRRLEADAPAAPPPTSAVLDAAILPFRALDLPIVRLGFADRYFLMSLFALCGETAALLRLLAALGLAQVTLRPVYALLTLRRDLGYWIWRDPRSHRLGQNL